VIKNKRILVTGASGSIGSELCSQLSKRNKVFGLDINEMEMHRLKRDLGIAGRVGDIRNRETLRNVFDDFKPEVVFHAAAYKSVDMMEYVPEEAISTNVLGTLNVLDYSKIYEVDRFVFISTDKVVNAKSIMGKTKSLGETMTVNSGKGYMAVRFGNVIGSRGSLMEIWENQINSGGPLTITDERMERFFMTIPEAVGLVTKAAEIGKGGEIICFEMGKPVSILELAKEIINKLGRNTPIEVIGNRGGEVLKEELMTVEEQKVAVKKGDYYIIK
tara:strand:- start:4206 stop:5027 length:822 start_codon:yes stop_codon:yes gene_type:complete